MPSYNTASLISGSLDSVFAQTFRDFEVIIVNDGSPDTPQLELVLAPYLEKYPTQILYVRQPNKRAAGARNTAIRKAKGEFLAFLDSDDVWLPMHLSEQMKLFQESPDLDLVYCNALSVGDPSCPHEFMKRCPSYGPADFRALASDRCQIPISTVVVRKIALERAGLFDESLARCDDYDMWLRAAFHGAKIAYTEKVQVKLNEGRPGSLGVSRAGMSEAAWKILDKAARTLQLSEPDRILLEKRSTEARALYLLEEGRHRLSQNEFEEAKSFLQEANRYLQRPKLSLVLAGLKVAPRTTRKLVSLLQQARTWSTRYLPVRPY